MILDMKTPMRGLMQRAEPKKARARLTVNARSPQVNPQVMFKSTSANPCQRQSTVQWLCPPPRHTHTLQIPQCSCTPYVKTL